MKHRKYSRIVRMKFVEFASKLSYVDISTEYETATGVQVPKRTIRSFVQQIALRLLEANRTGAKAGIVVGDSEGPGPCQQGDEQRTLAPIRWRQDACSRGERRVAHD